MAELNILYVEDEQFLGKIVKESLESRGFRVRMEVDGKKGLEALTEFRPDVCVLDVMLPKMDGFSLAEAIRAGHPSLPIIFLTAKTQTEDVVRGFKLGGDDYLRKPFSMEELIVRIERLAERGETAAEATGEIRIGKLTLDPGPQILRDGEEERKLTFRESELLHMLYRHRDQVLDRKQILLALWQDDSYFNSRNLDVYISRIRNYLKADPEVEIITVKGQGYKFIIP